MPKKFDKEFKLNAARLVIEENLPCNKVSQDLGVGVSTLERWVREYKTYGSLSAYPGKGHLRPDDERIRRLERELDVTRRERDILKKALSIFSST